MSCCHAGWYRVRPWHTLNMLIVIVMIRMVNLDLLQDLHRVMSRRHRTAWFNYFACSSADISLWFLTCIHLLACKKLGSREEAVLSFWYQYFCIARSPCCLMVTSFWSTTLHCFSPVQKLTTWTLSTWALSSSMNPTCDDFSCKPNSYACPRS